uniref:TIGR04222 domain-containing membrane protein n=1 Tax=Lentzea alba TaxID=2714351 RepID=UPI0039BF6AC1
MTGAAAVVAEGVAVVAATDAEAMGCVTGGPARAAEVALVRLLEGGSVRIGRDGRVSPVQGAVAATPLEAQILGTLRDGSRGIHDVVRAATASAEAARVRTHVLDSGLLKREPDRRFRWHPWLVLLGVAIALYGVIGEFRWGFVAAGVLAILVGYAMLARDPGRLMTSAGAKARIQAEQQAFAHPVTAVAVHGLRGKVGRVPVVEMVGLSTTAVAMLAVREGEATTGCGLTGCGTCSADSCRSDVPD